MRIQSLLSQPCTSHTGALYARILAHPSASRVYRPARIPKSGPSGDFVRTFATSSPRSANHFDTHLFVQRLKENGLTESQAEGLMKALAAVIDDSVTAMEGGLVSKADQEKQRYAQKVDFASLKSELQLIEKNDLTLVKGENERLMADVEKLKQRLREEVTRTQAGVRLDLNLEKGRIRDENSQQELKIREVDTRIESEIAGLRTQIEQSKISILQYLIGIGTGVGAMMLAYARIMM
ncbi:putative mitochondrion protein [Kockovaella imperatae]|uniref:Putative mitochondrion protein n=1 Tax=Kockovaella imperatae TaxID=4999 RepID=A0A1Y1UMS0_9TREE|nr:putative mitochondrion protein [Kockovaella imperatae]ORX39353.1 putative mitochondrion protein [Kockovaella imperatae]